MGILSQSLHDLLGTGLTKPGEPTAHLAAAIAWLCRAQDVGGDDGVARSYHVKHGWGASYPETTGYIIPSFFHYARFATAPAIAARARRMADWEIDVQMESGAVQGGSVDAPPSPAVFNTGQVLFGWIAAFRETGDTRYLAALRRAAEFLCAHQDVDGAWRRHLSAFCSPAGSPDSYCYNVRTAWALFLAGQLSDEPRFKAAALKNLEYVIGRTQPNGWTADNCLADPLRPLLHTIAYTTQGMLELGRLAGDAQAIELVRLANTGLAAGFERDGQLYGRYDNRWRPTVGWRCLTGEAQTAIVWFRLGQILDDPGWTTLGLALNAGLKRTQALSGSPDTRGGIKGSHPFYASYGKYQYLNWAAKFYVDALLLEAGHAEAGSAG